MLIEIRSSRHLELATLNITITIKTKLLIHGSNFVENKCSDATVSNVECTIRKVAGLRCAFVGIEVVRWHTKLQVYYSLHFTRIHV